MDAPQDNKSLEKSTEGSEQNAENQSSSVSIDVPMDTTTSSEGDDFIESAPAILGPYEGEFMRQVWGRRFPISQKFASGLKVPTTSTVSVASLRQRNDNVPEPQVQQPTDAQVGAQLQQDGASTSADAQRPDDAVEQRMNPRIEILSNNCCTALCVCYMGAVLKLRNSSFMYLFQTLLSLIPLSGVVFGLSFLNKCPKAVYLPGLCTGLGMLGLLFIGLWMATISINRRGDGCPTAPWIAFVVFGVLLVLAFIAEGVLVYLLVPSTDPTSQDYCDPTFYTFSIYKAIATAAAVGLSVSLYMPEICRALCCEGCLMRHTRPYYVL